MVQDRGEGAQRVCGCLRLMGIAKGWILADLIGCGDERCAPSGRQDGWPTVASPRLRSRGVAKRLPARGEKKPPVRVVFSV